jgi:hypothetical protein
MSNQHRLIILLLSMGAPGFSLLMAGAPDTAKNAAVTFPQESSRWSISAGVAVRQVSVDFHTAAPGPIATGALFSRPGSSGLGNVGVIHGGSDVVTYNDGVAGPDRYGGAGDSSFSVNSASQVTFGTGANGHNAATTPGEVRFHTSSTSHTYSQSFTGRDLDASTSDVGVGPYVNLRYALLQKPNSEIGITIGWLFVRTEHGSGSQITATQSVIQSTRQSNFTYAYDFGTSLTTISSVNSKFPPGFFDNKASNDGIVYDAKLYNSVEAPTVPAKDPRISRQDHNSARAVAAIHAISSSSLNLNLNTIPLMIDWTWKPCRCATLGIGVGPTLNVLDHSFTARTDWYADGSHIASQQLNDSGTALKVGASAQLVATIHLSQSDRWFIEAAGGYDWVDSQNVSVGGASAKIDVSSWSGRLGLGFRF